MDMKTEKKVFDSFMSTLMMCEHAPGEQEVVITFSLLELRQHVQWCQYAARLSDTAERATREYGAMQADIVHLRQKVTHWETQEAKLKSIEDELQKLGKEMARFNDSRRQLREVMRDAKTNN